MADDVIVFPNGVLTGTPFDSSSSAVLWLRDAADGMYGPHTSMPYGPMVLTLAPIWQPLPAALTAEIVNTVLVPWHLAITDPATEQQRLPDDNGVTLIRYRLAAGFEATARRLWAASVKQERSVNAAILGKWEAELIDADYALTVVLNDHVTNAWYATANSGLPVWPDPANPTASPPYTPFTATPVGTVRSGTV